MGGLGLQAMWLYGFELSVMKDKYGEYRSITGHEGTGCCWWCGGKFPDKRPRRFCCEECRNKYQETYYWFWAVPVALQRAGHKCEECGTRGALEVHHIEPLNNEPRVCNILNRSENLIVLCRACHGKRHRKDSWEKAEAKGQAILGLYK